MTRLHQTRLSVITTGREAAAFTILESLVMLLILVVFTMVSLAVTRKQWPQVLNLVVPARPAETQKPSPSPSPSPSPAPAAKPSPASATPGRPLPTAAQ